MDVADVPKRECLRVAINKVAQVPRVNQQLLERRAVKVAEGLECNFGQHFVEGTVIPKKSGRLHVSFIGFSVVQVPMALTVS